MLLLIYKFNLQDLKEGLLQFIFKIYGLKNVCFYFVPAIVKQNNKNFRINDASI